MDYSCPCCEKSLKGKGDLMTAELRNGYKQVTCIYCSKLIQIKSQYYDQFGKLFFILPFSLFLKLIMSEKEIMWQWWAGNAALVAVCYLAWRSMHLKQKNAPFYEEPRFNRPIPNSKGK